MSDFTVKQVDDMEAAFGGSWKKARAELGVTSFGMQVLDFPPNADRHPTHDHVADGQEEVFVVMRGAGEIVLDGEHHPLTEGTMVRVGPAVKRKLLSGPEGMRLLGLAGTPGQVYEIKEISELDT